jgi:hypothetical protein
MKMLSKILVLIGAAAVAGSVSLPWVTIKGASLPSQFSLDLGFLGADAPLGKSVSGTDTKVWPIVAGVAAVVAVLAIMGLARKVIVVLGLLTTLAGGGLLYYVLNVIDIQTEGESLKDVLANTAANTLLDSTAGAGPMLLIAGGLAILVGALMP